MESELLTRKEAAKMLKVKPDTLRQWDRSGITQAYGTVNGRPRYRAEDIAKVLKLKTEAHVS
jgi:predicted site-specific integrase-resolvase